MYIADAANSRIRKVTPGEDGIITGAPDEIIETVAGIGKRGFTRDKKLALTARVGSVDVAIDSADHLLFLDSRANRVRRVDKDTGIITTVVGGGEIGRAAGFSGDGRDAWHSHMSRPEGMVFDSVGNLYIADTLNHRVRMVTPGFDGLITGKADEIITTIAGSGSIGASVGELKGDGGSALKARLNRPKDVAIDADGNLVIADGLNHRLRRVILNPPVIIPISAPHEDAVVAPRQDDGPLL
jgi:sugar lactone lactonase YvrE